MNLLRDDLQWTWDQLCNSCNLGNPFEHTDRWLEVIRYHRGYWRRLLRRAQQHSILVASRRFMCVAAHLRVRSLLQQHSQWSIPATDSSHAVSSLTHAFGCMHCEQSCRTLAGEGAHMNRKHGQFHPVRTLIAGTQCGHCLKEFFTHGKLQAHLIRSAHCRRQLVGRQLQSHPLPGMGSTQVAQQHDAWDGRLPTLQAEGPCLEPVAPRDFDKEHPELLAALTLIIVETQASELSGFEDSVRTTIQQHVVSWRLCRRTLAKTIELLDEAELEQEDATIKDIRACLSSLCLPTAWPFLRDKRPAEPDHSDLAKLEREFEEVNLEQPSLKIQRPCTKERIFLHVFSGRRREGDLQFFMEKLYDQLCQDGSTICVVSLDLIIDQQWGNVRKASTQAFWLHGVRSGWVCGALCGPPCETWSQARFADVDALPQHGPRRRPRPLRDILELWGFSSLSIKEALQVATSCFCFRLNSFSPWRASKALE